MRVVDKVPKSCDVLFEWHQKRGKWIVAHFLSLSLSPLEWQSVERTWLFWVKKECLYLTQPIFSNTLKICIYIFSALIHHFFHHFISKLVLWFTHKWKRYCFTHSYDDNLKIHHNPINFFIQIYEGDGKQFILSKGL